MYLLVIGDRFQVEQAAAEHKIPFAFISEVTEPEIMTRGETPCAYESDVARWFCEPGDLFAPGTLLHYIVRWAERKICV